MKNSNLEFVRALIKEMNQSYDKSGLNNSKKNESHPGNQQWLDQFYDTFHKAKNAIEIMGDQVIFDMYGMFQPKEAAIEFFKNIDSISTKMYENKEIEENYEGQDHEVSMANNSLDSILWAVGELKKHLGDQERDIPAWIQDHITNAENFITQAAKNFHDYSGEEEMQEPTEEPAKDMSLASLMEAKKKAAIKLQKKKAANKK